MPAPSRATWFRPLVGVAVVAGLLLLSACAPGLNDVATTASPGSSDPAGFWFGLWHGLISPITFIISLFTETVGIYEVHNNGGWYDFGFMIGVSMAFGGAARSGHAGQKRATSRRRSR
ncbi:hypothetical protein [Actinotalea subterranea]|uniref:hypothetical protein n=1 Tax=Actinotalea subterranea TaxID=2607497 RepID=UPI0011EC2769|nr:hypothetical protein [Actinotalea subterranea]